MATVEQLEVKIGADLSDFNKGMANMSRGLDKAGKKMISTGKTLTKSLTLPIVAGFAAIGKAVVDLESTEAKYNTVFAGMTDIADNFIKEFKKLTPATKAEAQSMASGIQDLLVPMGFLREEATEMTGEFFKVAGALANFNSGTHTSEDVVRALQSAITGEFQSLKSLGIQLDATTVKQKAVEMGLIDSTDEMTKQVSAQVLLAEVYAQSGDALNAYTEENLDAKTQIGLLKSELVDVGAEIGVVLLPIIVSITEKVRMWTDKFAGLDEKTQNVILTVAALVAGIGPVLIILGKLATSISTLSGLWAAYSIKVAAAGTATTIATGAMLAPIAAVVLALGALIAVIALVVTQWDTLKSHAEAAGSAQAAASKAGKFGGIPSPGATTILTGGALVSPLPQFATGTNFVPSTGLALIHQGEAIIPANVNAQNRGDSGGGNGATINIFPQTITESTIISLFNRFDARLGVDG